MKRNKKSITKKWEAMMDFEEIKKSLWHAFDVLDDSTDVKKSRVRVLTNNLGHVLGVEQAETIWDNVNQEVINFDLFVKTLRDSLLVGIDKNSDPHVVTLRAQLDDLCWMLCERKYSVRIAEGCHGNTTTTTINNNNNSDAVYMNDLSENGVTEEISKRALTKTDLFKLWKIFNFLCERSAECSVLFPLRVDIEELDRITNEIHTTLGLPAPACSSKTAEGLGETASFLVDFCRFVRHIVDSFSLDESEEVISHGIAEVHSQIVSDVIRKGYMVKFGNKVTAWKDRWFVLTASALRYYASSEEKDFKGTIFLCSECSTESFPDKPGGKHHRFKLHTPNKHYELSAPDLKSKNMWISDLRRVISHIGSHKESLQLVSWKERKKAREERRRRMAEDELRRCAEREALLEKERLLEESEKQRERVQAEVLDRERLLEQEKQIRLEEEERRKKEMEELLALKRLEIDAEKQKCQETELRLKAEREELVKMNQEALEAERTQREAMIDRLKEEEVVLEREKEALKQRLTELEESKKQLENVIEEERALKRDEEIVRNLQAKILEEEFAKREELERLRDEQKKQLLEEKLTRKELEEAHHKQEAELLIKQQQLDALISEREDADVKWKDASDKLKQAEADRIRMEERLKLKEMSTSCRLAKPTPVPDPNPFVTHRGPGAFSEADFVKGKKSPSNFSDSSQTSSCDSNHYHSEDKACSEANANPTDCHEQ